MHRVGPGFFCSNASGSFQRSGKPPDTFTTSNHQWARSCLCARSPSAVSARVSGFSGLLREEAFELGGTSEIQRRGVSDEIRPFRTGAHASHPRRRAQTRAARRQVRAARLSSSHRSLSHLNLVARRLLLVARSLTRRRGCDARVLHPKGPISQLTSRA